MWDACSTASIEKQKMLAGTKRSKRNKKKRQPEIKIENVPLYLDSIFKRRGGDLALRRGSQFVSRFSSSEPRNLK